MARRQVTLAIASWPDRSAACRTLSSPDHPAPDMVDVNRAHHRVRSERRQTKLTCQQISSLTHTRLSVD